jgi:ATP-binding cassette, subfamily F, member 3
MQERLAQVEEELPRVEGWVAETEQAMGVYVSAEETQRLTEVLAVLRDRQAELTSEWERLATELEGQMEGQGATSN